MAKKVKKNLWVNSSELHSYDGVCYMPTIVNYKSGERKIGKIKGDGWKSYSDFKVLLGEGVSKAGSSRYVLEKTPVELAADFIRDLVSSIPGVNFLADNNNLKIMVAEPLSFNGEDKEWLTKYRSEIKSILHGFGKVEFLPEPFAVYQYYRYGLRHVALQGDDAHIALILDFGGGTFDACLIKSTKKGDVGAKGVLAHPLSSDSCKIGGFFINRAIARECLKDFSKYNLADASYLKK
ncbi:MAG: hypothetical protein REI12_07270 [Pedobacter sp.]|nr:hypothetical protein [Pedobacter sp.]